MHVSVHLPLMHRPFCIHLMEVEELDTIDLEVDAVTERKTEVAAAAAVHMAVALMVNKAVVAEVACMTGSVEEFGDPAVTIMAAVHSARCCSKLLDLRGKRGLVLMVARAAQHSVQRTVERVGYLRGL